MPHKRSNPKTQKKENGVNGERFESDTQKIVHRHLEDENHTITEEEIRNVRIGMTPPLDQPTEQAVAESEERIAELPSDIFLWAAVGSIAVSLVLQVTGIKKRSLFVGQWVAPFLVLGLYNKLVKLEGHD